jgi:hypothetical protein
MIFGKATEIKAASIDGNQWPNCCAVTLVAA